MDGFDRLNALRAKLEQRGVIDVKFHFNAELETLPASEVADRVADFIEAYMAVPQPPAEWCEKCGETTVPGLCRGRPSIKSCRFLAAPAISLPPAEPAITHGVNCPKVPHARGGGELHAFDDDTPYNVDGCTYCGRCHRSLP